MVTSLKVLMTSSVEPFVFSGVGNVEKNLIKELKKSKIFVGEYFPKFFSMAFADLYFGMNLRERFKEYDIIHAHSDISWNTENAIRTFHGVSALGERFYLEEKEHALMPSWKQRGYFIFHKFLEKNSAEKNWCIAVSNYVKNNLIKFYGAEKGRIHTVYNGIDANFFKESKKTRKDFRRKFEIENEKIFVTWVGHKEFNKGLHYLAGIVEKLKDEKNIIFGIKGPIDFNHKEISKLSKKAKEKIKFVEFQNDMRGFYNASDIHISTSVYEPFCLTILEGMACSKPIIAFKDSGGHEEILENAGILVELRNSEKMVESIKSLAENEEKRKKIGRNARKIIEKKLTKEIMAENTIKFYEKILENK